MTDGGALQYPCVLCNAAEFGLQCRLAGGRIALVVHPGGVTNAMNKYQRIVIAAGMCLILLAGLFPPYVGIGLREGDNLLLL